MHEQVHCRDEAATHQLTVAVTISLHCISQPMENIEVALLINCLAWRGVLMMDNTFPIKKHS